MTIKKGINLLRENFIFYLAGAFLILGLKCYYSQADCDSLLWILAPTAHWVQFLSKIPFTYISGTGYVNHSLRMVIAPSCSGVRFMIITFAMLVFSFVHVIAPQQRGVASENPGPGNSDASLSGGPAAAGCKKVHAKARGAAWIAASALFSWLFTVFVNGLRIIIAIYLPMYLEDAGLMNGVLTQERLHTMIGVVVYFSALLVICQLAGRMVQSMTRSVSFHFMQSCAAPVFWYFALTLGIPFLNRVCREGDAGFKEFAVLVTACCALVLLPYILLHALRRRK